MTTHVFEVNKILVDSFCRVFDIPDCTNTELFTKEVFYNILIIILENCKLSLSYRNGVYTFTRDDNGLYGSSNLHNLILKVSIQLQYAQLIYDKVRELFAK